jgi:hypothetical protein
MFKCLRSSKITPNSDGPLTAEHLKCMSKQALVELCLKTAEENKRLAEENKRLAAMYNHMDTWAKILQKEKDEMHARFTSSQFVSNQLRIGLRREIATLSDKKIYLENKCDAANRRETGLRIAVTRQIREIKSLKNDITALQSDQVTPFVSEKPLLKNDITALQSDQVTPFVSEKRLLKNIKETLEYAERCLTDPVTLEPLTDPVTLNTGHTFNRTTLDRMLAFSRERYGFSCPITKQSVEMTSRSIANTTKSIVIANMTELFLTIKANMEAAE